MYTILIYIKTGKYPSNTDSYKSSTGNNAHPKLLNDFIKPTKALHGWLMNTAEQPAL